MIRTLLNLLKKAHLRCQLRDCKGCHLQTVSSTPCHPSFLAYEPFKQAVVGSLQVVCQRFEERLFGGTPLLYISESVEQTVPDAFGQCAYLCLDGVSRLDEGLVGLSGRVA